MDFILEDITETNEELLKIQQRAQDLIDLWKDKEKLKAYIDTTGGESWDKSGVCAVINIDIMCTGGLSDQIAENFKGVNINWFGTIDTCYPVAGREEFVESTGLERWSNPKRLRYIKHIIRSINKIIKLRSLQDK